jgi:hypothetical protein
VRGHGNLSSSHRWSAVLAAVLLGVIGLPGTAHAVGTNPADWTPQLASTDSNVRQLTPCGGVMFAAGSFSAIKQGGVTFTRHNAFAFSATTGKLTSFNPDVNGVVNSIALDPTCRTAYLGGRFTSVGGSAASNLAAVSVATGALIPGFKHSANGQVNTLLLRGAELIVGGFFTAINGAARGYFATMSPSSGSVDGLGALSISGHYVGNPNPTRVFNLQLSHGGTRLLVEGDFTSVNGHRREQVFMLSIGSTMTLTGWYSNDFFGSCANSTPFYIQDAAWSPDDNTIYLGATGLKPEGTTGPGGLCDSVSAYPSAAVGVSRKWLNQTGCDSIYSVVADASSVYVGGHLRYLNNEGACNSQGSSAVSRPGLGAVSAATGRATSWNPTRSRGVGADDLVLTGAGLWVGSDNQMGAKMCGGETHAGICFLPN